MYKLTEHEFFVGAGLVALLDNNEEMLPTWINISNGNKSNPEQKTRRGKGAFYHLETKTRKSFVVYIKYTKDLSRNKLMQDEYMWSFNLSRTEKDKIQEQYEKVDTLFLLLVCKKDSQVHHKLDNQVILLTWDDYCEISHRSTIQVGIMKSDVNRKSRQHYYSFKIGKGVNGLENYYNVKRNKIERMLDEYAFENHVEEEKAPQKKIISDELERREIIYVKDNVNWCAECNKNTQKKIQHKIAKHQSIEYVCPKCKKKYMDIKQYYDFKDQDLDTAHYSFILLNNVVSRVYVTNDNHSICEKCSSSLMTVDSKLKIYKDIRKSNHVERKGNVNLFYCKNCKRYYVTPPLKKKFEREYGTYKINFRE